MQRYIKEWLFINDCKDRQIDIQVYGYIEIRNINSKLQQKWMSLDLNNIVLIDKYQDEKNRKVDLEDIENKIIGIMFYKKWKKTCTIINFK